MPRQSFISKEFFVNVSEKDTRLSLLSLPQHIEDIKFVTQHSLTQSITFLFQNACNKKIFRVCVSLLPLSHDCTQINLHISHSDDQLFYYDKDVEQSLLNFESAIHAALKGDTSLYIPSKPEPGNAQRLLRFMQILVPYPGTNGKNK
ncbi:MAG: hypothetical protein ICV51_06185 [Flavisolibacter sp.]|nr:hypothetical protein [Flavisolibacter sp.]MBD0285006.1 hypothetical protein [Flavisolibacter sp.]MBD0298598.1 hypothetical protein [Flavisolibacter sp.]MBD0350149.1 hypothetical protein [Flavisolibacter sp.]MBD0375201.1 hypothetical protein [Flavisolibacter sp.]